MQQIVSQLVLRPPRSSHEHDIATDLRPVPLEPVVEMLEAQKHCRLIKTHLPLDNLVFSPKAKYVFVARDGRDAFWSIYNHMHHATPLFYQLMNDTPGRVRPALLKPPADPRQYFLDILGNDEQDSVALPFWKTIRGWYSVQGLPNSLLVHFNDLKADLSGEIKSIGVPGHRS